MCSPIASGRCRHLPRSTSAGYCCAGLLLRPAHSLLRSAKTTGIATTNSCDGQYGSVALACCRQCELPQLHTLQARSARCAPRLPFLPCGGTLTSWNLHGPSPLLSMTPLAALPLPRPPSSPGAIRRQQPALVRPSCSLALRVRRSLQALPPRPFQSAIIHRITSFSHNARMAAVASEGGLRAEEGVARLQALREKSSRWLRVNAARRGAPAD